jgi:hypothetical protein
VAAAIGLNPDRLRAALAAGILVTSVLISESYGAFGNSSEFRAGFYRLEKESTELQKKRYQFVREIVAMIPADSSVTASEKLGSHLSSRDKVHKFPHVSEADWVVVWERDLKGPYARKRLRSVRNSREYALVQKKYDIVVYRSKVGAVDRTVPDIRSRRSARKRAKPVLPRGRNPLGVAEPVPGRREVADGGPGLLEGNGD